MSNTLVFRADVTHQPFDRQSCVCRVAVCVSDTGAMYAATVEFTRITTHATHHAEFTMRMKAGSFARDVHLDVVFATEEVEHKRGQ